MKEIIKKIIEQLEELKADAVNEDCPVVPNSEDCEMEYSCASRYLNAAIKIVKELAEEYMTCYKSCTECEAYDKEKHHCPKFCYIIEETVKEIEENHNGWIPCSERLPEESLNSVLGWDEHRKRCCFVQYIGGRWVLGNDDESVKITAWQPLPELYKG